MKRHMSCFSSRFMPAIASSRGKTPRRAPPEGKRGRRGGGRPRELDALLQPVGQPAYRRAPDVLDLEEVDDLLGRTAMLELFALRRPEPQCLLQEVATHLEIAAAHDVVEHAHALEERDVLEGAGEAERGRASRVHAAEFPATEDDLAFLRAVDPVQDVQHRALAGAVRADDGADLVLLHVEGDLL